MASYAKQQGRNISENNTTVQGRKSEPNSFTLINSLTEKKKKFEETPPTASAVLFHDRSSCSDFTKVFLAAGYTVNTDLDTKAWMMISLQQGKQQRKTFQKDDTRQHCPSHSDTLTALDTEMRWFECQPKKKKKIRCNSTPYSTGATWLCNTGDNWCNKCLKVQISGFICRVHCKESLWILCSRRTACSPPQRHSSKWAHHTTPSQMNRFSSQTDSPEDPWR